MSLGFLTAAIRAHITDSSALSVRIAVSDTVYPAATHSLEPNESNMLSSWPS